jgi:predicted nucleic acid-binding Zn ribbon protein
MPIFDRLQHGAELAKFKANQLLRINHVQGEINGIKREIQVVRENVVTTTITLHQNGSLSIPELEELCLVIDKLKDDIRDKEALIESIRAESLDTPTAPAPLSKPTNPCPKCNYDVPMGSAFCINCGTEMPTTPTTSDPGSDPSSKCPYCGNSLPSDSEFCPNCGKMIAAQEQGG